MFETIKLEKKEHVAIITLNRPEVLNALNVKMIQELIQALNDVKEDDSVRAVVITGAGRAFSSGGDIKEFKDMPKMLEGVAEIVKLITNIEKPVIAAVNGVAVGAGCNLALACDIIIASDKARFGEVFVRVGLIPDTGGTFLLPRYVGLHIAKELVFTGKIIDAQEAKQIGLVNRVVPSDEFEKEVMSFAKMLANGPTKAIGLAKKALNRAFNESLDTALDIETYAQLICAETDDHKEGVSAFLEKREPVFKGK